MNGFVFILLIGAIGSVLVGILTSLLVLWPRKKGAPKDRDPTIYWSYGVWTVGLGAFLLAAPANWYGPSWSVFPELPHNGYGMGICLLCLSSLLILALRRHANDNILAALLFLIGFVYWTSGIILGSEGLVGHQGLMEAPFMLYVGGKAFVHSAVLRARAKIGRNKDA